MFKLYHAAEEASYIRRANRFLVQCSLNGRTVHAHLPNPGRMWELLLPGCTLMLVRQDPPGQRKTTYTVAAVKKGDVPVLLHTQHTNAVARWLIEQGRIEGLEGYTPLRNRSMP